MTTSLCQAEPEITNRRTYARCVRDLSYVFNRKVDFGSHHILIIGKVSVNEIIGNSGIDFSDDYNRLVHLTKLIGRDLCYYKKIDCNRELLDKMKSPNEFIEFFCTSTSCNKLGKSNHRYKATRADQKIRLKFYKKCGLKNKYDTQRASKSSKPEK